MDTVHTVLEVLGAISFVCGVLSHLTTGRVSAVLGELGLDVAGFVQAYKGK